MNIAFVLINAEMGYEDVVSKELRELEEVKEVYGVYGVYDLVVKVEADTIEKLKDVISKSIRSLEKVRSTLTMIAV
ncbi:MAG: Lrp/AsnC family transcriptional regulator [Candidatus Bathyarchaeia archaeon]